MTNNEELNDLKSIIRSLLLSSGFKCDLRQLARGFYEVEGRNLRDVLNGFGMTLYQFLVSIPDVCKLARVNGELTVHHVSNEDSEHLEILKRREKKKPNPNQRPAFYSNNPYYNNNHNNILTNYNNVMIHLANIYRPNTYSSQMTNNYNVYNEKTFYNPSTQENTPSNVKKVQLKPNDEDWDDNSKIISSSFSNESIVTSYKIDNKMMESDTITNSYITTVLRIQEPRLKVAENGRRMKIRIIKYTSPWKFVFQFNLIALNTMIDDMTTHYEMVKSDNKLKISTVIPGMTVAVLRNEKWYRGQIRCVGDQEVLIEFVDFAERKYVPSTDLRYLKKSFAHHPKLARVGSLFNVKPKNGETSWNDEAHNLFIKLVKDVELFVKFESSSDEFIEMSLFIDAFKRTSIGSKMILEDVCELEFKEHSKDQLILE